ncbi:F0F1 ATP synthase subunit A [bacterium]|jgi:F-type H+-transporting ATPase subunit a|nr:F0F1 ATP synthase subunit A [bacterium]MBT4121483.1 F0F1 ATP synthase subunit A [bacterium]MBT4495133.1 F0F1 ATP synthase subunit A [bacterium]MBT4764373.1 F0F1 ATP synthase subunit A [bacterium]MBT5401744.1 F0F1 ATP synthase subunit A [bacterium]
MSQTVEQYDNEITDINQEVLVNVESHNEIEQHETTEQISHEPTLFAEPVFNLGNFTVTNALLNSWIAVLIIVVLATVISKKIKRIPQGIQNYFEVILEGAYNLADSVTGSRDKTKKVFPIVFSIFMFILINNWLGLVPGIGSIGFIELHNGHETFVPFFRGGTADLNTTLALALFTVIATNIFGIIMVGGWKYFNKFVNIKAFLEIPKKFKKDPSIIIVNPIKAFVGIIEIIGEIAKVASLSFRLFGNIFAGEVLLGAMATIFAFILPIPFMFLEVIVGIIQALIFAMLTLVYFTIASSEEH